MSEKFTGEGSDPVNEIFSGARDDRDLSEMVARDGQPVITRFTVLLGLAALFMGGIIVGTYFQTSSGAATGGGATLSAFRSAASGQSTRGTGGASGFGGFGGSAGGLGAPVASGQIKLIDGTNVYVTTETGSIVKVSTDGTTRIRKSSTLTVGQLKVGDTVSVSGSDGADGTVTATAINIGALPTGLGGGGTDGSASKSGSAAPSTTASTKPSTTASKAPSTTPKPSVSGAGRNTALIACLKKNGITVDPTQGTRALRNSTDPKVQAAFAKCRTSAFPGGRASPTP
jgi:hypothetical protein